MSQRVENFLQSKSAIASFFILFVFCFASIATEALTMQNSNFILRGGNFNQASGRPTNSNYKLGFTSGELGIGLYSGTNYKVRAGFQYLRPGAFRFSITNLAITFGTLNPGEPISRTSNLTVTNTSAYGYSVTAAEDHPMRVLASGVDIPDTTCDSGTCTQVTPSAWTSLLTYGFGYRCDNVVGSDCPSGFATSTFYRQFANLEGNESPQYVMQGVNNGTNTVQITYKVNISQTQAAGLYQNVIRYIATPSI